MTAPVDILSHNWAVRLNIVIWIIQKTFLTLLFASACFSSFANDSVLPSNVFKWHGLTHLDYTETSIKVNGITNGAMATWVKFSAVADHQENVIKRDYFENALIYDKFRIFFTFSGEHALLPAFVKDKNNNQLPDFVEDIMTELVIADKLLESFGFDMLNRKGNLYNFLGIKYVDVFLSNYTNPKERTGYFYGYKPEKELNILNNRAISSENSVLIRVHQLGRRLKKTIPHELFHAYQYSYSTLLNDWFVEGTAVWFEQALSSTEVASIRLPASYEDLQTHVLSKSYATAGFWNRLMSMCSNPATLNTPEGVVPDTVFILNSNEKIFPGHQLAGLGLMRTFFENLSTQSNLATTDMNRSNQQVHRFGWTTPMSKAQSNNPFMLKALHQTLQRECADGISQQEVSNFMAALGHTLNLTRFDSYP